MLKAIRKDGAGGLELRPFYPDTNRLLETARREAAAAKRLNFIVPLDVMVQPPRARGASLRAPS